MRVRPVILFPLLACRTLLAQGPEAWSRTVTVDRGAQDAAISPDGTRIAMGVLGKIWLLPIGGGRALQLTFGSSWDSHPAWSPDGQFIAYAFQRPGRTELVIHNLATGGSRTAYSTPNSIGHIAYHPVKSELFFILDRNQFDAHLWSLTIDNGRTRQLTFGAGLSERSFAISPAGTAVVLEHVNRGASDLYEMNVDSLRARRMTNTQAEEFGVQWSADGKELVYLERIEGVESVVRRVLGDSAVSRVFSSLYDGKQIALHPDGRTAILVAARRLHRLDLTSGRTAAVPFEARFILPSVDPADLTITNARMFDGTGSAVVESANVEVRAGRITRVWTGAFQGGATPSMRVVDAKRQMLLPGLMDNHYHFWHHWTFAGSSLIARGITAIRDPGVEVSESLNFRDAFALGILEGPDLYTLGPLIDGTAGFHPMVDVILTKPAAAQALVRALKALGVDGIKVYQSLSPEVLRAVVAEALSQRLPVTGDIGSATLWDQAVAAGVTGLNHAYIYRDLLRPPDQRPYRAGEPLQLMSARQQIATSTPLDPDKPIVDSLFRVMAAHRIAFDPTLVTFSRSDSSLRDLGLDRMESLRAEIGFFQRLVRKAFDAGVPLLAGTDVGDFFDELELYEKAGIPSSAILQAATINGARWLGKENDFGTIEVGKRANLILVDGDPLKQMRDLRKVSVVIKDGRVVFRR